MFSGEKKSSLMKGQHRETNGNANLRHWYYFNLFGPLIGYYSKEIKSWIVVKTDKIKKAEDIFRGLKINMTSEGHKYLGGVIGKTNYKRT